MKSKNLVWKTICIKITSTFFPLCCLLSYTKPYTNKAMTFNWKLQPVFHATKIYTQHSLVPDPSKKTENNHELVIRTKDLKAWRDCKELLDILIR